jgi:hypothetical protein
MRALTAKFFSGKKSTDKQLGYQSHRQVPLLDYIVDFFIVMNYILLLKSMANAMPLTQRGSMMLNDNPDWKNAESDFYVLMTIG